MKTKIAITTLALTVGVLSGTAHADVARTSYQFRGERAEAEFNWAEPDGCTRGWLYVAGGESVTHDVGGRPVTSTLAYAWYVTMNFCDGTHQRAFGTIEGGANIERLDSASIQIPMTVLRPVCAETRDGWYRCDEVPTGEVAMLRVALEGAGATTRGVTMTSSSSEGFRSVAHDVGVSRAASATATLVIGGVDHLAGAVPTRASIGSSETNTHTLTQLSSPHT